MTWEEFMEGFWARHPGLKGQKADPVVSEPRRPIPVAQEAPKAGSVEAPKDYKSAAAGEEEDRWWENRE